MDNPLESEALPPQGPVIGAMTITRKELELIHAHREAQRATRTLIIKVISDSLSDRIDGRTQDWSGWMGTVPLASAVYQTLVEAGYISE